VRKQMISRKLRETDLLAIFQPGAAILPPLVVRSCTTLGEEDGADLRAELSWQDENARFPFVIEAKTQSTPSAVRNMINQVREAATEAQPMIVVPYLSPERLDDLERENVSGVDLCGNGIVIVPGRLFVRRMGQPNQYRESRPLNNPYAGRSALVARMLLERKQWRSLNDLTAAIHEAGAELSLPQASKAVRALQEELIVFKKKGLITLQEPLRLLDRLGQAYRKPKNRIRKALKLPKGTDWARILTSEANLRWALTGESSAVRYAVFGQGGPPKIAVSDLRLAEKTLNGVEERISNFADVELVETDEPGTYFQNELDQGVRWASRLQTWLELQAGDARQQDTAHELYTQLIKKVIS
jgi:hypothetical protein